MRDRSTPVNPVSHKLDILYLNTPVYDYLTATLIEGLILLGHNILCSEESNYGTKIPDEDLIDFADKADLIIIGSNIGVRFGLLREVSNSKIVYIDGTDFQSFDIPEGIRFKAIFKRELGMPLGDFSQQAVFPLQFAAEQRYFSPARPKDILVSFLANMRMNPLRQSIHTRLQLRNQVGIISGSTNERAYAPGSSQPLPIATPGYHELLSRSLISINVPGFGFDCARYWEIVAARAMLLTYKPDITIQHGFQDGVNCVTFDSLGEFEDKLEFYIRHTEEAQTIAERGYEHLIQFHTTKKRAEQFLTLALENVNNTTWCTPPL